MGIEEFMEAISKGDVITIGKGGYESPATVVGIAAGCIRVRYSTGVAREIQLQGHRSAGLRIYYGDIEVGRQVQKVNNRPKSEEHKKAISEGMRRLYQQRRERQNDQDLRHMQGMESV